MPDEIGSPVAVVTHAAQSDFELQAAQQPAGDPLVLTSSPLGVDGDRLHPSASTCACKHKINSIRHCLCATNFIFFYKIDDH